MEDRTSPYRVLEFYSGIGGMRFAMKEAGISATFVEAFDINDIANDVYDYNFGHRPNQGNIQRITIQNLEKYNADAWLMSPPCQPFTRQGLQKDNEDARSFSFLRMLELLPYMSKPPMFLFVENVVGFESSETHRQLITVFENTGLHTQEFILSPLHLGIPYSRPRYFCLAKKRSLSFLQPKLTGQLIKQPEPFLQVLPKVDIIHNNGSNNCYLVPHISQPEAASSCRPIQAYLETDLDFSHYQVSNVTIERWGDVFDIVTPESQRCCCFTKSYGRFIKGTGSYLATKKIMHEIPETSHSTSKTCGASMVKGPLTLMGLRYFTPREIANLHSFPPEFKFPDNINLKQRYALLGNSLSVAVVALLLKYLFATPLEDDINSSLSAI